MLKSVLTALAPSLLLLFAACSSEDPAPSGGNPSGSAGEGGGAAPGTGGSTAGTGGSSAGTGGGAPVGQLTEVTIHTTAKAGGNLVAEAGTLIDSASTSAPVIEVSDVPKQEFLGFGTSLTEASAAIYNRLSEEQRTEALNAIYRPHPDGANYVLNRTHIGSADFSSGDYHYAANEDLSDFSLDPDRTVKSSIDPDPFWNDKVDVGGNGILHYMQLANDITGGQLKVMASPWSPPAFMRDGNSLYGEGRLMRSMYDTYADYFVMYVQAMEAEGIPIWALTPQNESNVCGWHWETHCMSAEESAEFVGAHLGPKLEAAGYGDILLLGYDHNKGDGLLPAFAEAAYGASAADPSWAQYHDGMAHHWYKNALEHYPEELDETYAIDPSKLLMATEQSLDSFTWAESYLNAWQNDAWWWENLAPDWTHGPMAKAVGRYAKAIITDLNHWTSAWISWNAALDSAGGPNHRNNACTADVMVDLASGDVYYTPTFYVMQHFTRYIRPGSHILDSTGADSMNLMSLAAVNTDGSISLVVFNEHDQPQTYAVRYQDQVVEVQMPAASIQTIELR